MAQPGRRPRRRRHHRFCPACLLSPVTGIVAEINEELLDSPELLNDDPYANWIIKVEQVTDTEELMSAAAYADLCETEA